MIIFYYVILQVSLCKFWKEGKTCPFGEHCHYAHGDAELVNSKGNSGVQRGRANENIPIAPIMNNSSRTGDYYTGTATGFMFTCSGPMVQEIFHK